jgi:hypothetical protein
MRYVAAVLANLVFVAGYLYGINYQGHAIALGGLALFGLAIVFNRAQQGSTFRVIESTNAHPLELGSLIDQLDANKLMPLYVQYGHITTPVRSAFIARLDNQRAVVLETN